MHTRFLIAFVAALVLGPGCGDDGGGGPSAKSEGAEEPACEPVGSGGGTKIEAVLAEWSITVSPASAPAGRATFALRNDGKDAHEFVVVKGNRPDGLPVKDGKVDEEALPEGSFVGEVEPFPPGGSCQGTFELAAGPYVLFCNIAENEPDGSLESHYQEGMRTAFTVQ
jgi:hypothetical protein